MVDAISKMLYERAEQVGALKAENAFLRAALKVAEKAIDDCLESRCHINYGSLKIVRAALAHPTYKPGADAEPVTQTAVHDGATVGRTGGSIPPTGATQ